MLPAPLSILLLLTPPRPDLADLKAVNKVARGVAPEVRCEPGSVSEQNLAAMRDFERAGTLYAVLALQTDNLDWMPDFIDQAVESYDRARACAPEGRQAELLARTLDFLTDVEADLLARGALRDDDLATLRVREHRGRLNRLIPFVTKPPADTELIPVTNSPPPAPKSETTQKRRALSYFSLQLRLGLGRARVWSDINDHLPDGTGVQLGFSAGARFLVGRRHSFGIGFTWDVLGEKLAPPRSDVISPNYRRDRRYWIHRPGLYARYGVYLVPRALSVHFEGGIGMLAFPYMDRLADTNFYVAGLACAWMEAFCLRAEGFRGLRSWDREISDTTRGWNLAFMVDPLRLAEHGRERRDRR